MRQANRHWRPSKLEIESKSKEVTLVAGQNKEVCVALVTAQNYYLVYAVTDHPTVPTMTAVVIGNAVGVIYDPTVTVKDAAGKVIAQVPLGNSEDSYTIKTTKDWVRTYKIVATFDARPYQTKPVVAAKVLKVLPRGSPRPPGPLSTLNPCPPRRGMVTASGFGSGGRPSNLSPRRKRAGRWAPPARSSTNAPNPKSITATPAGKQRRQLSTSSNMPSRRPTARPGSMARFTAR